MPKLQWRGGPPFNGDGVQLAVIAVNPPHIALKEDCAAVRLPANHLWWRAVGVEYHDRVSSGQSLASKLTEKPTGRKNKDGWMSSLQGRTSTYRTVRPKKCQLLGVTTSRSDNPNLEVCWSVGNRQQTVRDAHLVGEAGKRARGGAVTRQRVALGRHRVAVGTRRVAVGRSRGSETRRAAIIGTSCSGGNLIAAAKPTSIGNPPRGRAEAEGPAASICRDAHRGALSSCYVPLPDVVLAQERQHLATN